MTVDGDPILVTTAPISPGEERRSRERRYLITMAVRLVAFIVAVVFATGWIRVVAVILALLLPWVAVVVANQPAKRSATLQPELFAADRVHELE